MRLRYTAVYLETLVIGMVLTIIVLLRIHREHDRQTASRSLRCVASSLLLILLLDAAWLAVDGRATRLCIALNHAFNIGYLFLGGFIPYMWFRFVLYKQRPQTPLSRVAELLLALPLIALLVMCVASPWTHWLYTIPESNVYQRGPLHYWQQVIGFAYGLAATGYALQHALRERNAERRAQAFTLSSFAVLPLLGGVVTIFFFGIPAIWPFTAISLNMIYLNLISRRVTTDSLTGLNNRGLLDQYLSAATHESSREDTLTLLLLDIDDFKIINDTFGHVTGDHALVKMAEVLKGVCGARNAFLARYGGDEFAIVVSTHTPEELTRLRNDLAAALRRFNACNDQPYRLRISYGESVFSPKASTPTEMLEQADAMLYRMKTEKRKAAGRSKK